MNVRSSPCRSARQTQSVVTREAPSSVTVAKGSSPAMNKAEVVKVTWILLKFKSLDTSLTLAFQIISTPRD